MIGPPEPDEEDVAGLGPALLVLEAGSLKLRDVIARGRILMRDGAIQVKDAAGLERELDRPLSDRAAREELGKNAVTVVRENLGAIDRTVEMIVEHLEWAS